MTSSLRNRLLVIAAAVAVAGCAPAADPAAPNAAAPTAAQPAVPGASSPWPASLDVLGDGFPNPGDACRRIGESAATSGFLDHTATLVGCRSTADAAKLGGKRVGTVEGVTLVSVPASTATPGDGDGGGDARVAGTVYHATAKLPCAGYKGGPAGLCDAGVVRNTETGTYVDVTLPDGRTRAIFFNADGSFLSFSTAQSDGTAAMASSSTRKGDVTIARLGTERYEIPDAFVLGD